MKPRISPEDLEFLIENKRKIRDDSGYGEILKAIGDVPVVLIGEASHGTQDFYQHRAEITRELIQKKGFNMVVVEGDWTDCYRVNRFVRGGKNESALEILCDFKRFPLWMWRNKVVLEFVEWMKAHNDKFSSNDEKCGFYGMDLYGWFSSMEAVLQYLKQVSPSDYQEVLKRYSKFNRFHGKESSYGYATEFGLTESLEKEVVEVLIQLEKNGPDYLRGSGAFIDGDELFFTQQNAELVKNAEEYYRSTYMPRANTWNLRDQHMADTILNLFEHYKSKGITPKAVIWAHNSHLGDARHTEASSKRGEWNVGQLIRQTFGIENTYNIGFSAYRGSVTAAKNWDEPAQFFQVKNGIYDSFEHLLHCISKEEDYLLITRSNTMEIEVDSRLVSILSKKRLERFIGVIYAAKTERYSHYSKTCLSKEYDSIIHLDHPSALEPLDITPEWKKGRDWFHSDPDSLIDDFPELIEEIEQIDERISVAIELIQVGDRIFFEKKNVYRAREVYKKSLSYVMNNYANEYDDERVERYRVELLERLARCSVAQEDWNGVLDCCQKIIAKKKTAEILGMLCKACMGKSRWDLAMEQLREIESMNPEYEEIPDLKKRLEKMKGKDRSMLKRGFLLQGQ